METYHGTTNENADAIISDGFKKSITNIDAPEKMPCDLGDGIYTYCQDGISDPYVNAQQFARQYKSNFSRKFAVLAVDLPDSSNLTILDLDSKENQKKLAKIFSSIEYRVQQIYDHIPDTGAKRRHNLDGVLLEYAFQHAPKLKSPDIVLKSTFTDFHGDGRISSFPNGRELVIRNTKVIVSVKKVTRCDNESI